MKRKPAPNPLGGGIRLTGPHLGRSGVWRYNILRDGIWRWGSLHTKDETKAKLKMDEMAQMYKRLEDTP